MHILLLVDERPPSFSLHCFYTSAIRAFKGRDIYILLSVATQDKSRYHALGFLTHQRMALEFVSGSTRAGAYKAVSGDHSQHLRILRRSSIAFRREI